MLMYLCTLYHLWSYKIVLFTPIVKSYSVIVNVAVQAVVDSGRVWCVLLLAAASQQLSFHR